MLKKSIKQLLAYYSYYLIMAIIVCILQFQIQQMFWKNTEKLHTSTLNLPTFKTIDPYWSKKKRPRSDFSYWFCCAVKFTSRFTNKCHGKNAVEQADFNHNHHHNRTRLCDTTIKGGKTKGSGLNLPFLYMLTLTWPNAETTDCSWRAMNLMSQP